MVQSQEKLSEKKETIFEMRKKCSKIKEEEDQLTKDFFLLHESISFHLFWRVV